MGNRIIKSRSRGSSIHLTDCLSSLLALELMVPSPELYLISPWISDVPLISNRFGQFRAVTSEMTKSDLRLATVLGTLAERGARIRIVCRPSHPHTDAFLRKLPSEIERRTTGSLHEKGLISYHFYLRGSMNFTYSGVNLNDESIELTTDPEHVALALAEAARTWEELAA